jgi:hypothetical protein
VSLVKKAKLITTLGTVTLGSFIGLTALLNAVPQKANADVGNAKDNSKDENVVLTFSTVGDSRADAAQPNLTKGQFLRLSKS